VAAVASESLDNCVEVVESRLTRLSLRSDLHAEITSGPPTVRVLGETDLPVRAVFFPSVGSCHTNA
jgi:hypothetical protein